MKDANKSITFNISPESSQREDSTV